MSAAGVTLFETLELRAGVPFALSRHLARLTGSCRALGQPEPDDVALRARCAQVAAAWGAEPGRLRVTWQPGNRHLVVHAAPMRVRVEPVRVMRSRHRHDERSPVSGHKTAAVATNVAAAHEARRAGADEALLANHRDELCEGTTCNVVLRLGDELCTPALESGCLPGVTRALLLEATSGSDLQVQERRLAWSELADADEVLLVSTGRLVQPVAAIDGRELIVTGASVAGPLRRCFVERYRDLDDP
jgi:branched-chain amino acid aminotransferase